MENIVEPTYDFDFSKLHLGSPISTSGGSYFTKMLINNKSLYLQTPKSLTKQGFIKSGKKIYTDLMFSNVDNIFIDWLERLQNKCEELIFEKSETWFETKMERDDIETAFTSPVKIFKSGKNYLVRVSVKNNLKIYDENNNSFELENMTSDKTIISILEIQGIKFTSKNFQIEMELKQCMMVSSDPFLEKCFIKTNNNTNNSAVNATSIGANLNVSNDKINLDDIFESSLSEVKNEPNVIMKKELKENIKNELKEKELKEELKGNVKNESKGKEFKEEENNFDSDLISLEVEDLTPNIVIENDPNDELCEVNINFEDDQSNNDVMQLKNRNQVYREIYQKAKEKATELKRATIVAYLELKNIKNMYMLDDIIESDDDLNDLDMLESDTEPNFSDEER